MTDQASTTSVRVATPPGPLVTRRRVVASDQQWAADAKDQSFLDHVFTRSSAKKRAFTNVDFRYSAFDVCYFRDCKFDSCDFTGCRFIGSNFHGSTFTGCKFDYAHFERTQVDSAILDFCCPSVENLKLRFARTLRMNFQALGDAASVNKAILVELDATSIHLYKAWQSNESYYRKKYAGVARLNAFLEWSRFKALDVLWGNGERPAKLARFVLGFLVLIAAFDVGANRDPRLLTSYWAALLNSVQVFLGTGPSPFGSLASAGIAFARLVTFGLFVSILVRRFARR
jgi:uncharacterized protein YjbI with pentapeptide repeats